MGLLLASIGRVSDRSWHQRGRRSHEPPPAFRKAYSPTQTMPDALSGGVCVCKLFRAGVFSPFFCRSPSEDQTPFELRADSLNPFWGVYSEDARLR